MHSQGKLVVLNSAQGSPKLDSAATLDFVGVRESMEFLVGCVCLCVCMCVCVQVRMN